jgi:hypothetical protein
MPSKRRDRNDSNRDHSSDYMTGGKGRKDDVRGSGIYPASSPDAPADAEIRTESGLVKHKGPKPKPFKKG